MAQNGNETLLFVNKTSRSASLSNNRSDQTSRKKINRHVQQTRDLERERDARIQRLKPTRLNLFSNSPSPTSDTCSTSESPSCSTVSTLRLSDSGFSISEDEEAEEIPLASHITRVVPEGGTVEPFNVCRVPLDNERYRILQYFVLEMFPAISRSDTPAFFTGPTTPSQQAAVQMIRDCLTDEMHTFALLTASSARMKYLTRAPFSRSDLPERFADQSLTLLRTYLSQNRPADERLILTIFFMAATESYRKDWAAVRTHQNMIKHLYSTHLAGFHSLGYHLRKMIWFQDRFQASATATAPVIEEMWEQHELSPAVALRVLKAIEVSGQVAMGSAFTEYMTPFFSPEFQLLLHDVTTLACVVQCYWTTIKESYPDRDWTNGRSHVMLDKLLVFKDSRGAVSSSFAVLLQDCVRLAMITWLALIGSPATGVALQSVNDNIKIRVAADARPLRRRFATLIAQAQGCPCEERQHSIDRLFLWIAGLGGLASELKENIDWFCERFQELAEKMSISSWKAFAPIGRAFLWLDRLEAVNNFRLTKVLEQGHVASTGAPPMVRRNTG